MVDGLIVLNDLFILFLQKKMAQITNLKMLYCWKILHQLTHQQVSRSIKCFSIETVLSAHTHTLASLR